MYLHYEYLVVQHTQTRRHEAQQQRLGGGIARTRRLTRRAERYEGRARQAAHRLL